MFIIRYIRETVGEPQEVTDGVSYVRGVRRKNGTLTHSYVTESGDIVPPYALEGWEGHPKGLPFRIRDNATGETSETVFNYPHM